MNPGSGHSPASSPLPRWAGLTLRLAGLYNLVWGTSIILAPQWPFWVSGIEPSDDLTAWRGIGMIVGVYGLGYWIAASNPLQHWPIVLVGFLGKVFGPVGFVIAATSGQYPWSLWWLHVLNDVIWWVPFAALLWLAAKWNQPGSLATLSELEGDPLVDLTTSNGQSIRSLSAGRPLLVVFLRHAGCTFCREALADLQRERSRIEASGTSLAVVQMGTEQDGKALLDRYGLGDVPVFSDPDLRLYRAFDIGLGRIGQLFGPSVWWRGFQAAILAGHGVGKLQGNGFQMPGAFVVRDGKIISAFRHRHSADRPPYGEMACRLDSRPEGSA